MKNFFRAILFLLTFLQANAAERPNILFILVDDLGYMDIGANNPESFYETPNIDALANQGGAPFGAVRDGDWKLIEWYEDMRVELYDLKNDLGEQSDLAKAHPAKDAEFTKLLHDWRKQVGAKMPTPNPKNQTTNR